MSKRQNQHPRTDLPPFRLCLSPSVREVRAVSPRTLAPSVLPLAMERGAGEERLAWPSPTTPALPCFACPLVEAPLPWGAASRQGNGPLTYLGHLPASARWWCQLGTYSHTEGKHQAALSWAWESQPTLEGRGMTAFAQAGKLTALSSSSSGLSPSFILPCLSLRALAGLWSLTSPTLTSRSFFSDEGVMSGMWLPLACVSFASQNVLPNLRYILGDSATHQSYPAIQFKIICGRAGLYTLQIMNY